MLHIIHTVESLVLSALIVAAAAFGGDGLLRIGMAIATKALTIYLSLLSGF